MAVRIAGSCSYKPLDFNFLYNKKAPIKRERLMRGVGYLASACIRADKRTVVFAPRFLSRLVIRKEIAAIRYFCLLGLIFLFLPFFLLPLVLCSLGLIVRLLGALGLFCRSILFFLLYHCPPAF